MTFWDFAIIIALPLVFRIISNLFTNKKKEVEDQSPKIGLFYWKRLALYALIAYSISQIITPPTSLFNTLHLDTNVPGFKLRRTMLDFISTRRAVSDGFETKETFPFSSRFASKKMTEMPDKMTEKNYLHALLDFLLVQENRYLYLQFGHETVMNCDWCREEKDYFAYSIPDIVGPYLFLIVSSLILDLYDGSWIWSTTFSALIFDFTMLYVSIFLKESWQETTQQHFFPTFQYRFYSRWSFILFWQFVWMIWPIMKKDQEEVNIERLQNSLLGQVLLLRNLRAYFNHQQQTEDLKNK